MANLISRPRAGGLVPVPEVPPWESQGDLGPGPLRAEQHPPTVDAVLLEVCFLTSKIAQ